MIEKDIQVINQLGLHARASAKLVQLVSGYRSEVMMAAKGRDINAKSIMGVLMLAAGVGAVVRVRVDGPDEVACMSAIEDLFNRYFDEGS